MNRGLIGASVHAYLLLDAYDRRLPTRDVTLVLPDLFRDSWIEIGRFETRAEAEEHVLVLLAMGIDCRLIQRETGIGLGVAASDVDHACDQLAAYREENQPQPAPLFHAPGKGVDGALVYCAVVVFVFSASGRQLFSQSWEIAGSAQAGAIFSGEWWRVFTALGLHADGGHLVANLIVGSLFGVFLAQIVGAGLAWLSILLAGGAGNALNAWVHPASHTTIGASTAVFAALGLLAALTWKREALRGRRGRQKWLPLAAGVMLLAFLGVSGPPTDVGAHLAGFLAGCVFGTGLHFAAPLLPQGRTAQYCYSAATLALFALAWLIALGAT